MSLPLCFSFSDQVDLHGWCFGVVRKVAWPHVETTAHSESPDRREQRATWLGHHPCVQQPQQCRLGSRQRCQIRAELHPEEGPGAKETPLPWTGEASAGIADPQRYQGREHSDCFLAVKALTWLRTYVNPTVRFLWSLCWGLYSD